MEVHRKKKVTWGLCTNLIKERALGLQDALQDGMINHAKVIRKYMGELTQDKASFNNVYLCKLVWSHLHLQG